MLQNGRYNVNFVEQQLVAELWSKNLTALKGLGTSSPSFIEIHFHRQILSGNTF